MEINPPLFLPHGRSPYRLAYRSPIMGKVLTVGPVARILQVGEDAVRNLADSGPLGTLGLPADSAPEVPPESVRTPVIGSSRCYVCEVVKLRGRQTVCSAACRRERSRRREAERRRARDREIAALLEAALRKLQEGTP